MFGTSFVRIYDSRPISVARRPEEGNRLESKLDRAEGAIVPASDCTVKARGTGERGRAGTRFYSLQEAPNGWSFIVSPHSACSRGWITRTDADASDESSPQYSTHSKRILAVAILDCIQGGMLETHAPQCPLARAVRAVSSSQAERIHAPKGTQQHGIALSASREYLNGPEPTSSTVVKTPAL